MFESARGVVVIADLADAASLVLKAATSGAFGPGPLAVVTVAERLKPAALQLQGAGRCTTQELLLDGRAALEGIAVSQMANMALLGIEFSRGFSPAEESEAVAAATGALVAQYDPVIVLNRHIRLAPVLRQAIQMSAGVIIIAGTVTPMQEIRAVVSLSRGFGKLPALWFDCRGDESAQDEAVEVSAAAGIPLWGTSLPLDLAPDGPAPESDSPVPEPHNAAPEKGERTVEAKETAHIARVVEVERPSAPASQPQPHPPVESPAEPDDLIARVRDYVAHLQGLRQYRSQLLGTREEMQQMLLRMNESIRDGKVPGIEEIGDLSRRRGVLEDLANRHEQSLKRCSADWTFLQRVLDPDSDGPGH